ncbi:hypothetical protein SKAU_G00076950 [Synaphobranchus kaupii]|uniref:Uncharacterized protein n=1 Tax=Synaphobranchus kaupii TaxID=118154 RepID=A0A9Q1JC92_SYNKA|nr:hypothetical protein SKAU_G00076950 [Synaphobranchus kaupii]
MEVWGDGAAGEDGVKLEAFLARDLSVTGCQISFQQHVFHRRDPVWQGCVLGGMGVAVDSTGVGRVGVAQEQAVLQQPCVLRGNWPKFIHIGSAVPADEQNDMNV